MANIPFDERLMVPLSGEKRAHLEANLLPYASWKDRSAEMPAECRDVVTGDAFYAGCEGIGYTPETGWYLVLWEPVDEPEAASGGEPIGDSGLTLVGVDICPNSGPSTVTLLFMERRI